MNQVTKDIMKLLKVDLEMAIKVQEQMRIDFSECTTKEFNKEVRFCHKIVIG